MFTTKQVDDVVSEIEHVNFYRCTQIGDARLVFDFIPAPGFSVSEREITEKIRSNLPFGEIDVRQVSRLEPEPSMKFRLTGAVT